MNEKVSEGVRLVAAALDAAVEKASAWLVEVPLVRFTKGPDGSHAVERTGKVVRYGPFHDEDEAKFWGLQHSDDGYNVVPMVDVRIFSCEMDKFHARQVERRRYNRAMEN